MSESKKYKWEQTFRENPGVLSRVNLKAPLQDGNRNRREQCSFETCKSDQNIINNFIKKFK